MGIQFNRKTGNYSIRVKHYGRDYEKVIGPDKRKAELALLQVKTEIKTAKLTDQGWQGFEKFQKGVKPKTFSEVAEQYLAERATSKPSTLQQYRSVLRAYLLPEFGRLAIKEITPAHLRKFRADISAVDKQTGKQISPVRVNIILQIFKSIINQAESDGVIDKNPCKSLKPLQEPKTKIDPLSDEELSAALACITPFFRPFFIAQAYTGARPNELQALRWSDIDWANKQISISKGRVRGHEGLPKTRSGDRLVPLLPPVEAALAELKVSRVVANVDDYVFINRAGNPIDKHMDEVWRRALRKAGLRHRPSYQLRHTFVTNCIIKGMPLPYIAKIIGHSTIDTLVRHYAGWIDASTNRYEEKLRESFAGALHRLA